VNTSLALQLWVWSKSQYHQININDTSNLYDEYKLGDYVWIYITAPLVAGALAGCLSAYSSQELGDIKSIHRLSNEFENESDDGKILPMPVSHQS
jgi:hypothetical protein